jgi:hypothetical protein
MSTLFQCAESGKHHEDHVAGARYLELAFIHSFTR